MRLAWLVLVVAVVFFGMGEAWRQHGLWRQTEAERAALRERRSDQEARLSEARARRDNLEKERQRLTKEAERLRGNRSPSARNAKVSPPTPAPTQMALEVLELSRRTFERQRDPAVQARQLQTARDKMTAEYSPLFRELGFTSAQTQAFLDAAVQRREQMMDLSAVVIAQNLGFDDPAIRRLFNQMDTDFKVELRARLSAENYSRAMEYERALPMRPLVSGFVGTAAVQGVALTGEQSEQLVQAIAEGDRGYRAGGPANNMDVDWEAVDAKAATILSPAQLDLFQHAESAGQGRYSYRFNRLLNQARDQDNAATASP
jgi:hypothetical protein